MNCRRFAWKHIELTVMLLLLQGSIAGVRLVLTQATNKRTVTVFQAMSSTAACGSAAPTSGTIRIGGARRKGSARGVLPTKLIVFRVHVTDAIFTAPNDGFATRPVAVLHVKVNGEWRTHSRVGNSRVLETNIGRGFKLVSSSHYKGFARRRTNHTVLVAIKHEGNLDFVAILVKGQVGIIIAHLVKFEFDIICTGRRQGFNANG